MKRIGVDVDDVLCNFIEPFLKWYDTDTQMDDITSWTNHEFTMEIFDTFYATEEFKRLQPVLNANAVLDMLEYDRVYAITARPESTKINTQAWINEYFGDTISGVMFGVKNKGIFCRDHGIETMIDDRFETIEECSRKGVHGILMNKPWNKKYETPANCHRVDNWMDVYGVLK